VSFFETQCTNVPFVNFFRDVRPSQRLGPSLKAIFGHGLVSLRTWPLRFWWPWHKLQGGHDNVVLCVMHCLKSKYFVRLTFIPIVLDLDLMASALILLAVLLLASTLSEIGLCMCVCVCVCLLCAIAMIEAYSSVFQHKQNTQQAAHSIVLHA